MIIKNLIKNLTGSSWQFLAVVIFALSITPNLLQAQSDKFKMAYSAYQNQDFETAGNTWYKLAEGGDINAQYAVGVMELRGETSNASPAGAFKWLKKAADQGHSTAMFNIGVAYWKGSGIKQDRDRALQWWEKSAIAGDRGAQLNLGLAYYIGEEKTTDLDKAAKWIGMAAKQNHPEAERIYNILAQENSALTEDNLAVSEDDSESNSETVVAKNIVAEPQAILAVEPTQEIEIVEEQIETEKYWKTIDGIDLLTKPGKSGKSIGSLPASAPVEIIKTQGDWSQVTLPAGLKMWVFEKFISVNNDKGVIKGTGVRVRPKPTTDNKISPPAGSYRNGDKVAVLNKEDLWYQVRAPKHIGGWIPNSNLENYQDTKTNRTQLWDLMMAKGL